MQGGSQNKLNPFMQQTVGAKMLSFFETTALQGENLGIESKLPSLLDANEEKKKQIKQPTNTDNLNKQQGSMLTSDNLNQKKVNLFSNGSSSVNIFKTNLFSNEYKKVSQEVKKPENNTGLNNNQSVQKQQKKKQKQSAITEVSKDFQQKQCKKKQPISQKQSTVIPVDEIKNSSFSLQVNKEHQNNQKKKDVQKNQQQKHQNKEQNKKIQKINNTTEQVKDVVFNIENIKKIQNKEEKNLSLKINDENKNEQKKQQKPVVQQKITKIIQQKQVEIKNQFQIQKSKMQNQAQKYQKNKKIDDQIDKKSQKSQSRKKQQKSQQKNKQIIINQNIKTDQKSQSNKKQQKSKQQKKQIIIDQNIQKKQKSQSNKKQQKIKQQTKQKSQSNKKQQKIKQQTKQIIKNQNIKTDQTQKQKQKQKKDVLQNNAMHKKYELNINDILKQKNQIKSKIQFSKDELQDTDINFFQSLSIQDEIKINIENLQQIPKIQKIFNIDVIYNRIVQKIQKCVIKKNDLKNQATKRGIIYDKMNEIRDKIESIAELKSQIRPLKGKLQYLRKRVNQQIKQQIACLQKQIKAIQQKIKSQQQELKEKTTAQQLLEQKYHWYSGQIELNVQQLAMRQAYVLQTYEQYERKRQIILAERHLIQLLQRKRRSNIKIKESEEQIKNKKILCQVFSVETKLNTQEIINNNGQLQNDNQLPKNGQNKKKQQSNNYFNNNLNKDLKNNLNNNLNNHQNDAQNNKFNKPQRNNLNIAQKNNLNTNLCNQQNNHQNDNLNNAQIKDLNKDQNINLNNQQNNAQNTNLNHHQNTNLSNLQSIHQNANLSNPKSNLNSENIQIIQDIQNDQYDTIYSAPTMSACCLSMDTNFYWKQIQQLYSSNSISKSQFYRLWQQQQVVNAIKTCMVLQQSLPEGVDVGWYRSCVVLALEGMRERHGRGVYTGSVPELDALRGIASCPLQLTADQLSHSIQDILVEQYERDIVGIQRELEQERIVNGRIEEGNAGLWRGIEELRSKIAKEKKGVEEYVQRVNQEKGRRVRVRRGVRVEVREEVGKFQGKINTKNLGELEEILRERREQLGLLESMRKRGEGEINQRTKQYNNLHERKEIYYGDLTKYLKTHKQEEIRHRKYKETLLELEKKRIQMKKERKSMESITKVDYYMSAIRD